MKKQRYAIFLLILLGIVLLFSSVFLMESTDHDCTGENCPVCGVIELCGKIFQPKTAKTTLLSLLFPLLVFFTVKPCVSFGKTRFTLVKTKQKLSE